jgi:hypothetical protein
MLNVSNALRFRASQPRKWFLALKPMRRAAGHAAISRFDSRHPHSYLAAMLRTRTKRLETNKWAPDEALHYLACARDYGLSNEEHRQLIEVVVGYTGLREALARAGLEWMREQAKRKGLHKT